MVDRNGISKLDLKRLNRAEILKLMIRYGPMSRIDIAQQLQLTRAAVTIITNEMIEQNVIYEKGEEKNPGQKASRGRKKILLDIHENCKFSLGIVLDRNKVFIGLSNLKGQTLHREELLYQGESMEELVEALFGRTEQMLLDSCLSFSSLLGTGLCISGNAVFDFYHNERERCLARMKKLIEIRFQLPVVVDGTTEGLAMAEMIFNENFSEKPQNMIFIRYGYDVDAAIVLGDDIYRGSHRNFGWFPHLVVDAHGERCDCGKVGCCFTKMSIYKIIEKIKRLFSAEKTPLLYKSAGGKIENVNFHINNLKNILADDSVKQLYQEALEYLTTVLDNLLIILDPDKIVLYGFVFEKILPLDSLNEVMEKEHNCSLKDKVALSVIPDYQIHLAGCGLCVKELFVERGGL